MDSKYIVFNGPGSGLFPVIFPPNVKHSMIASAMHERYPGIEPVSAGFVSLSLASEYFNCYGESQSLKLGSDPEQDSSLIDTMFNIGG